MVPFIKWVGGKRQLINELVERMPKTYNTYHEPFIGGGALFFHVSPKKAIISDLNKELITTYKVVKANISRLREYLLLMEYGHYVVSDSGKLSTPFYNKIREIDRNDITDKYNLNSKDSNELIASRFIYMNKNNFNGLYRVNSSGFFNVPCKHKSSQKTFDWENLKKINKYLKNSDIKIQNKSFSKTINQISKNDFIYLDPPYDYEEKQSGFDSYNKESFGQKGQIELAEYCKKLDKIGAKFMLSNHNTKLINSLYKKFNISIVSAKRLVGGKGSSRKNVEEVIITNY